MNITVNLGINSYDIVLDGGTLERIGKECNLNRKVLIVTDSGVPAEYAAMVGRQCKEPYFEVVESGEASKSLENFAKLHRALLNNGFNRKDCIVAVGGGVVGDLCGFVASTYMRGIDFYNVPTTVLSQVDSSIGGKTAIDFEGVKNVVGTFYQPKKVIIDFDVLDSLEPRQVVNGLSEAIKMAFTFDKALFEEIENMNTFPEIFSIIAKSILIKKDVVEKDEKESGLRKVLNFGHTLGHGIEAQKEGELLHGECVALGMTAMCEGQVRERLLKVLKKFSLPTSCDFDYEKALEFITHDKKANGSTISAIVVNEIGTFEIVDMTREELGRRLKTILEG
ncbi:MAG: 3-dehydroquinate synthase [Lachnospiraceae bacterium]|nr:3-dehydroquinate synthase [Lachnospiraceae bacterium]